MIGAEYAYQIDDDYEVDVPNKRFSIIGLLSKIRNICILVLVVSLAYTAWPSVHYDSYLCFRLILGFIFNREAIAFIVESIKTGFTYNPIGRAVELLVIAVAIWKLIFKGKILAFLRVKSIVMLALASFWLYLILFEAIRIEQTPLWGRIIEFYTYSPFLTWLYPLGLETALKTYVIMVALVVCYLMTVIYCGSSVREGQRLDRDELEELGINDVLRRVNPIRRLFLPRPRFYVTDSFSQNAYSSRRNIVIALDVLDEGIEVAQGVIAHELGHYYHYDTDASLICNVAINTVIFPLMIVTFMARILSHIPLLGIAAGLYGLLLTVFGAITGIIFNLINLIFYWIDGKWAERRADMFSVDLGYGFGNYLFLSKYTDGFSLRALISGFLDVHPGIRSRCRYIRKRIIRYYGEDYWDSCVAVYGDYYV